MPADSSTPAFIETSARIVVQLPADLPRSLVSEYLEDCRKSVSALNASVVERDPETARVFGHQLKGTGKPYGFPTLTVLGRALEQAAVRRDAEELDLLFHQLDDYLRRVEIAGP